MIIGNRVSFLLAFSLITAVTTFSGCQSKSPDPVAEAPESDTEPAVDREDPAPETASAARTDAVGKWIMVLSQRGRDWGLATIEILPEDAGEGTARLKVLQAGVALGEDLEVVSAEIDPRKVDLRFNFGDSPVVFEGFLVNGVFRGSILLGASRCDPAGLLPTNDEQLGEYREGPPSYGRQEFDKAVSSPSPYRALDAFVKEFPNSPLSLNAFHQMIALAGERELTEEGVRNLAGDYLNTAERWGERMREMARINVGLQLIGTGYLPDLGVEFLNEAETKLTATSKGAWQTLIDNGRREAAIAAARSRADELAEQMADSEEVLPEVLQELRGIATEYPNDPLIGYSLALVELKADNKQPALEAFARLSVLPQMELIIQSQLSQTGSSPPALPSEMAARLWKELHGSTEGLDEYLSDVYDANIAAFAAPTIEPSVSDEGNRVSLVELFTGAQCPPCVAADVATVGLEATYPHGDVIVIRYHQHIPGPDPMANPEGEARFSYYQGQGTPTVALNGLKLEGNVGGFIIHAPGIYEELQGHVQSFLGDSTPVEIHLAADAQGNQLSIEANVTGLPEDMPSARLRLVLVEDDIAFLAGNGIRRHEWVVRTMPGGPEGIGRSENGIQFSETISLDDVRGAILTYLEAFENGTGSKFIVKPLEMQAFHLVGFVQDDETGQILQTAAIPIEGKFVFGDDEAPAPPALTAPGASSTPADAAQPANASPMPEAEPSALPPPAPAPAKTPKDEDASAPADAAEPANAGE